MKKLPIALAIAAITAGAANAAVITSVPDNVYVSTGGASTLPADISGDAGGTLFNGTSGDNLAFVVTTMTFDANSTALRLRSHFRGTAASGDRLGINVTPTGTVSIYASTAADTPLALGDLKGTTITFIMKVEYTAGNTWINVWADPDGTETEGLTTTTGGDFRGYSSSTGWGGYNTQVVETGVGKTNSVTDTVILTGADATFANALAAAGVAVPEPSSALLGGLGMLALLRRRRN